MQNSVTPSTDHPQRMGSPQSVQGAPSISELDRGGIFQIDVVAPFNLSPPLPPRSFLRHQRATSLPYLLVRTKSSLAWIQKLRVETDIFFLSPRVAPRPATRPARYVRVYIATDRVMKTNFPTTAKYRFRTDSTTGAVKSTPWRQSGNATAVGTKQRSEQISGDTPTVVVTTVNKPNSENTSEEAPAVILADAAPAVGTKQQLKSIPGDTTTAGVTAVNKPNSEFISGEASAVTWANGATIRPLVVLLTTIQSRPANLPIILLASLQLRAFKLLNPSPSTTALATLLLAHASYFGLGGTNSISSIDLSNAYNGVSSYNVAAVGTLLFISNWAGPIYWSTAGLEVLIEQASKLPTYQPMSKAQAPSGSDPSDPPHQTIRTLTGVQSARSRVLNAWVEHISLLTLFMAIGCTGVMGACLVLRTHLFVWTVFSPKFLYAAAWFVGWHLGVNLILCGLALLVTLYKMS